MSRLDEVKQIIGMWFSDIHDGDTPIVTLNDIKKIDGVFERVEELEKKLRVDNELFEMQVKQNQCYKQALEELESRALQEINLGNQIDPNEVVDIVRQS